MDKSDTNWKHLMNSMSVRMIDNGKTYAAFTNKQLDKVFIDIKNYDLHQIVDPMSGYGSSILRCLNQNLNTFFVEINPPTFLWQTIKSPIYIDVFLLIIDNIINSSFFDKLPESEKAFECSNDFFTDYGKGLFRSLFVELKKYICENFQDYVEKADIITAAITVPFSSRFSTFRNGDVAHLKRGGTVIYKQYIEHFASYLKNLLAGLKEQSREYQKIGLGTGHYNTKHEIILGDCSDDKIFANKTFDSMITSPPYPNTRDYRKMFWPENIILELLDQEGLIQFLDEHNDPIGTNIVSGKKFEDTGYDSIKEFFKHLEDYNKTKKAIKDNKGYYIPYFMLYFDQLAKAYLNIEKHFADDFVGYIIVVNNMARKKAVPVSEFLFELWSKLGYKVTFLNIDEVSHIGAKNPKTKGLSARHKETIIKISRGKYE